MRAVHGWGGLRGSGRVFAVEPVEYAGVLPISRTGYAGHGALPEAVPLTRRTTLQSAGSPSSLCRLR